MQNQQLFYLFDKYFQGKSSPDEERTFLDFVEQSANKAQVEEVMEQYWNAFVPKQNPFGKAQGGVMLMKALGGRTDIKVKKLSIISVLKYAAAVVIVASLAFASYRYFQDKTNPALQVTKITPGHSGATLTLADGRNINLDDTGNGIVSDINGITIKKLADGSLSYVVSNVPKLGNAQNTLSTGNGQTYQVQLPDGSKIWLNAGSSITYAQNFSANATRNILLSGEGYFEVAKDAQHPFIVESNNQKIEVLGTHFNVHAYTDDDKTTTTLLEGSVKLNGSTFIRPGEKAVLSKNKITVLPADIEMDMAWKNGRFAFSGKEFHDIMKTIARWYNVEIVYDDQPEQLHIAGGISRYEDIQDVLGLLQETGEVRFKIEGRRVHVMR